MRKAVGLRVNLDNNNDTRLNHRRLNRVQSDFPATKFKRHLSHPRPPNAKRQGPHLETPNLRLLHRGGSLRPDYCIDIEKPRKITFKSNIRLFKQSRNNNFRLLKSYRLFYRFVPPDKQPFSVPWLTNHTSKMLSYNFLNFV